MSYDDFISLTQLVIQVIILLNEFNKSIQTDPEHQIHYPKSVMK